MQLRQFLKCFGGLQYSYLKHYSLSCLQIPSQKENANVFTLQHLFVFKAWETIILYLKLVWNLKYQSLLANKYFKWMCSSQADKKENWLYSC